MRTKALAAVLFVAVTAAPVSAFAGGPTPLTPPPTQPSGNGTNDLSDLDSVGLQMLMTSYSTLLQGMSNLMQSMADATQAIVQNLKQ